MELMTVACRCALRLCSIEAQVSAAKAGVALWPRANERSLFCGSKRTRLPGPKVPAPGVADPRSMRPQAARGHFPAVGLPYRTLGAVSLGPNLGRQGTSEGLLPNVKRGPTCSSLSSTSLDPHTRLPWFTPDQI